MSVKRATQLSNSVCYLPDWLATGRGWGISLQLYELRSARNWGIGDFEDLADFVEIAGARGADFVGLNPLHALFLGAPAAASPFSPSNRRFLNPLYIAVDRLDGFDATLVDDASLSKLRASELVDYPAVAEVKLRALRQIWNRTAHPDVEQYDLLLYQHAVFEALSSYLSKTGRGAGWLDWPVEYREPNTDSVKAFAEENAEEVSFQVWLQQIARHQLSQAAGRAKQAGMRIGLYLDFAVGEAPDGSATWSDKEMFMRGVSVGAPPDVFTVDGQNWGLAPLSPEKISRNDFTDYWQLISAATQDAGALRLDHAMTLRQLFWIPEGRPASEGYHVQYPMEAMIDVLATISHEARAVVIGEDLGHVPQGFRERMSRAGILSYRILYFEQRNGRFIPPRHWPTLALACLSTHDLPTLKGWWAGDDVTLRHDYALIDEAAFKRQHRQRGSEKRAVLASLSTNGLLSSAAKRRLQRMRVLDEDSYTTLSIAAHRFIARTPARLACIRLADAIGERHPTNLPGTSDEHPNWRRKLDISLENLPDCVLFQRLTAAMAGERPS